MKRALATLALIPTLALTACGNQEDTQYDAMTRCQKQVSQYAKHPESAQWKEVLLDEEQNGIRYLAGEATFVNDLEDEIVVNYHCNLDVESGNWSETPTMEPEDIPGAAPGRWAYGLSPMLEEYGDEMSLER